MPTSIVLLADDLSGALDSAVPFRAAGHDVAVAVDLAAVGDALAHGPDVLAVNLDCRTASAEVAAQRTRSLAYVITRVAPHLVMVKIDSRMKGPIAALIDAAMVISERRCANFCPAVPDVGRLVVDGHVVGSGVDTPIAIAGCLEERAAIVCHDAGDAAAMDAIAESILLQAATTLAVGARGLAQALARLIGTGRVVGDCLSEDGYLPVVLAIGSQDPVTAEQIERLRDTVYVTEGWKVPAAIGSADVILLRPPITGGGCDPAGVAAALAEDVAAVIDHRAGATIIASGGDTAMAIARRLGLSVLLPLRDLVPGIPLSTPPGRPTVRLATKSGGFGDRDALVACLAAVSGNGWSGGAAARRSA